MFVTSFISLRSKKQEHARVDCIYVICSIVNVSKSTLPENNVNNI